MSLQPYCCACCTQGDGCMEFLQGIWYQWIMPHTWVIGFREYGHSLLTLISVMESYLCSLMLIHKWHFRKSRRLYQRQVPIWWHISFHFISYLRTWRQKHHISVTSADYCLQTLHSWCNSVTIIYRKCFNWNMFEPHLCVQTLGKQSKSNWKITTICSSIHCMYTMWFVL